MRNHTDSRHPEQMMAEIETLDLAPIKFKISSKGDGYGWASEHVDRIELGYRRFLVLLAKNPRLQIAPTRDIDAFWHAHILDTRKYAADCERIFGRFVHHYPYLGMLGDQDKLDQAANTLRKLFVSEFGEDVPNNARRARADGPSAAWCGNEPPADKTAAWCGVEPTIDEAPAWCGVEPTMDTAAAWCGVEVRACATGPTHVTAPTPLQIARAAERTQ